MLGLIVLKFADVNYRRHAANKQQTEAANRDH